MPATALAPPWDANRHLVCMFGATLGQLITTSAGKFFGKTGEPPVQTKLEEAFGGKRKRTVKAGAKEHDKPVAAESSPNEGAHAVTVYHLSPPIFEIAPRSPSPTKDGEVIWACRLRSC